MGNIAHFHADSGRTVCPHEVGVDFIEGIEVIQVGDEDRGLGDVGNGKAGFIQDSLEVGQSLDSLFLHVCANDFARHGMEGHLAAQIVGGTGLDAVGVGADRGTGFGSMDELHAGRRGGRYKL